MRRIISLVVYWALIVPGLLILGVFVSLSVPPFSKSVYPDLVMASGILVGAGVGVALARIVWVRFMRSTESMKKEG